MAQVLIIVDAGVSAEYLRGITTLQKTIASPLEQPVQVITVSEAEGLSVLPETRICPLTLNLPDRLPFWEQAMYSFCRDVPGLRSKVAQQGGTGTGNGQFWLPIVLTAKGPLYAEVIAPHPNPEKAAYTQPLHLPDRVRQPLYQLGHQLLNLAAAPPAVYLLQFGFQGEAVVFDRLFPFPAAPAVASLDVQTPNLFECHWRCLTHQPILDLRISGAIGYQSHGSRRSTRTD